MAKAFLGTWKTDVEHRKNKNFEVYNTTMGLSNEVKEQFGKIRDSVEYVQDGDTITCNVTIDGNVIKTYKGMQQGKEERIIGIDGKPCLFCYRIEDGIWKETYKPQDGKGLEVQTTKVVNGNKLTTTHTVVGKGVTYSLQQQNNRTKTKLRERSISTTTKHIFMNAIAQRHIESSITTHQTVFCDNTHLCVSKS